MSVFAPAVIKCGCGGQFRVEIAESVHVARRPDLRDAILDGTFHRFLCPHCGEPTVVEKLLAYTDLPRRHWFTVFPDGDLRHRGARARFAREAFEQTVVQRSPPLVKQLGAELLRRVIFGLPSLREKLALFDVGLNDQVVELLKLELLRDLGVPFDPAVYFYFDHSDRGLLRFSLARPAEESVLSVPVSRARYDSLALRRAEAAAPFPEIGDGDVVDFRAALVPDEPLPRAAAQG